MPLPNTDFVAIAGGGYNSFGLRADGSIVAWGYNEFGQTDVPAPNTDFIAVAGGSHCLGLKVDGSIVAWGRNTTGQTNIQSPNTGFAAVAGGYYHSVGLKGDDCDACDMNCDGEINSFDIEPFLDLLFDPGAMPCRTCTGDANGDGQVDAFDIEPFMECLFGP